MTMQVTKSIEVGLTGEEIEHLQDGGVLEIPFDDQQRVVLYPPNDEVTGQAEHERPGVQ